MIILASTSATRQIMLKAAGISFTAVAPQVDERQLTAQNQRWTPVETAQELARAKAMDVSRRYPKRLVIGADQVLALGDKIYSKPQDVADCRSMLLELRDRTHQLISAVACIRDGDCIWSGVDRADLTMRHFSEGFLSTYLDTMGMDCTSSVGGYKIEGVGVQLFSSVRGDHFTILGLPLLQLMKFLRTQGELAS